MGGSGPQGVQPGLLAGLTFGVHFVILALGSESAFAGRSWQLVLSFKWPSIAYALDILAWDVCFALAALFVTPVFGGSRLATRIRVLMLVSGAVALAGLGGVIIGDMRLRNIGVIGYAVSSRSRRSCSQSCSSEPLPRR